MRLPKNYCHCCPPEQDQIEAAIEAYRSYLVGFGATFEVCFLLAEPCTEGDLNGARERYYMAIELNEGYVEHAKSRLRVGRAGRPRIGLGCVSWCASLSSRLPGCPLPYRPDP